MGLGGVAAGGVGGELVGYCRASNSNFHAGRMLWALVASRALSVARVRAAARVLVAARASGATRALTAAQTAT